MKQYPGLTTDTLTAANAEIASTPVNHNHRKAIMKPTALIALLFLFVAATVPAYGNTRFGFGTIVDVDEDGSRSKSKKPEFTICYEFHNLAPTRLFQRTTYPLDQPKVAYFLDGKMATAAEAIKVGRAVCMSNNRAFFWVSSGPGLHATVTPATASDCWLQLSLKDGFSSTVEKHHKKGKKEGMKPYTAPLNLLIDIREGRVVSAATASPVWFHGAGDCTVDHSTLTLADGRLSGVVALVARFPANGTYRLEQGTELAITCTIDVTVNQDGAVTGSYTGSSGGQPTTGTVTGERHGRSPQLDPSRLWLLFWNMQQGDRYFGVVPVADNQGQPGGELLFSKGNQVGDIPKTDLTVKGHHVSGTLTFTGKIPITVTIDANIIGNRFLFGTWTTTEGDLAGTHPLRGGLIPGVDAGPQVHGFVGTKAAYRKLLQAYQKLLKEGPPPKATEE